MKILFACEYNVNLVKALQLLFTRQGFDFEHQSLYSNGKFRNLGTREALDESFKDGFHIYFSDIEKTNKNDIKIKALRHSFMKIVVLDDKFHSQHHWLQALIILTHWAYFRDKCPTWPNGSIIYYSTKRQKRDWGPLY